MRKNTVGTITITPSGGVLTVEVQNLVGTTVSGVSGEVTTRDFGRMENVFGVPRQANTTVISFTDTQASGWFPTDSTLRLVATEDCYVNFITAGTDSPATTAGVFMRAGIPEMFSTDDTYSGVSAIRADGNGNLHVTRMLELGR